MRDLSLAFLKEKKYRHYQSSKLDRYDGDGILVLKNSDALQVREDLETVLSFIKDGWLLAD